MEKPGEKDRPDEEEKAGATADDRPDDAPAGEDEEVDKASEDSFPASDPPSY